jgi:hypothetical protein
MLDYRLEIINRQSALEKAAEALARRPAIAVDIETLEWWNRQREKIALIQFAYRAGDEIKVMIVDALADCDVSGALRAPLESPRTVKIIHNAAFDAVKLLDHYRIETAPIYDTMLAARQSGEKKYSLQSQAAAHLDIYLNKNAQRSDWSRRPLDFRQIDYAARDAFATLLLYEHQRERNLPGNYLLKGKIDADRQLSLPLDAAAEQPAKEEKPPKIDAGEPAAQSSAAALSIVGIVTELPSRYSPEQLSVSVGSERVGLAGWIVDRFLGREADFDEETAKLVIGELCAGGMIRLDAFRRLEATEKGAALWRANK